MTDFKSLIKEPEIASEIDRISAINNAADVEASITVKRDDILVATEKEALENAKLETEVERLKSELQHAKDLHEIRKKYTGRLFWLIVAWLSVVIIFVTLTATIKPYFNLADSVLIAFITSTTISVLGLFILVAKWLFPSNARGDQETKSDEKKNG